MMPPLFERASVSRGLSGVELHGAVFNASVPHHRKIPDVVLVQSPRCLRSLARQFGEGAQNVPGVEVDHGLVLDVRVVDARRADGIAMLVHVVQ